MCGVTGWAAFDFASLSQFDLHKMTQTLSLRGPDRQGFWRSDRAAFGHRRLAVIDIEGGRQPMQNGEVVVTYSGEVYNYLELREELRRAGFNFSTASDTEVVLLGYLHWGESCFERLRGMFSIAIWDGRTQELLLARDRLGIKPLYYVQLKWGVIFASEPKSLFASGAIGPEIDLDGFRQVLLHSGLVKKPGHTPFRHVVEVEPGTIVCVSRTGRRVRRYWELSGEMTHGRIGDVVIEIRTLLASIVEEQLAADVPVCTLLSGGLDSSTITALAQEISLENDRTSIATYGVTFPAQQSDFVPDDLRTGLDDPYIRLVSQSLGTRHNEVTLTAAELLSSSVAAEITNARDMPALGHFDSSLFLLCQRIKKRATVALSGEGADEIFGGYPWFHHTDGQASGDVPWLESQGFGREHLFLTPELERATDMPDYRRDLVEEANRMAPGVTSELSEQEQLMRRLTYLHIRCHLPVMLDRKDRMSMANGLEVRVPFCDHRLVELLFTTPWKFKVFDGREKSLLRFAASGLVPYEVLERRKSAFPLLQHDREMNSRLRRAVSELLSEKGPALEMLNQSRLRAVSESSVPLSPYDQHGLEFILSLVRWIESASVRVAI
ncbi:asparagine synthase (glutamine-hydrolyzing) [Streptomyces sp. NPDC057686]|uniref:asparagine synthase (glutamine-hydrolyzing) n=1 Tax=Streptomyces sp. NPDC057686 TaxID=3346212 RepID=UPI0036A312F1